MAKWIKITDELPQPQQRVLVTIEDSSGTPMVLPSTVVEDEHLHIEEGQVVRAISFSVIKAWMPFPKPYTERMQDKAVIEASI